jgi:hypothetical protein
MSRAKPPIKDISIEDFLKLPEDERDAWIVNALQPLIEEGYVIDLGGGNYYRTDKKAE